MKSLRLIMIALLVSSAAAADQLQKHRGSPHGMKPPQMGAMPKQAKFDVPKYNRPETHGEQPGRVAVPVHHDSLGNHVTDDHMNRVDYAGGRAETVMKNNPHVVDIVHIGRTHYANNFRPEFEHKRDFFNANLVGYNRFTVGSPQIIAVWHEHHFYGGYYYGFHPILDIDTYFYNPTVYWFYVGTFDEPYYRAWYQDRYDAYPEFHKPFEYHGVYYPTDNMRQLLFGVSAMPPEKQARFRTAMTTFTRRLAQNMANGLGSRVTLAKGDVAVTHYEILGYDDAVVIEGMVGHNNNSYNYKGLLDLEHPEQTSVFVPATWDKNPNPEQLTALDRLNAKISAIGGVSASPESSTPTEMPPAPPAGSVTAEPGHNEEPGGAIAQ